MSLVRVVVLLCAVVCVFSSNCATPTDWFHVCWSVSGDDITFGVKATTDGWLGFGISDNGGMRGADLIILQKNGDYSVGDYFSTAFSYPTLDTSQDAELLSVAESDGQLTATISRPLRSCDSEQDFDIKDAKQWFIFARGDTPALGYHGPVYRGRTQINFLATEDVSSADMPPLTDVSITMPGYQVPTSQTNYVCSKQEIVAESKQHIYEVVPIIDNPSVVHHMIAFLCTTELSGPEFDGIFECSTAPKQCRSFFIGWGVGVQKITYPDVAALPFGPGLAQYLVLQVHYNNAASTAGLVDSSGFRIRHSSVLRENDIGTLIVGSSLKYITIPPHVSNYGVSTQCPAQCTNRLPADGITVIGNGLHMHQIGSRINTTLIRDGKEIASLGEKAYYDFNYQGVTPVPDTKIMPGDRIQHYCEWDSTHRSTDTVGGEASTDEMCFGFISYYPKVDLTLCITVDETTVACNGDEEQDGERHISLFDRDTTPYQTLDHIPPAACDPDSAPTGSEDGDMVLPSSCKGFERCQQLSDWFNLYWSPMDLDGQAGLHFRVEARTNGWVGFGLSSNGGMKGADMAVLTHADDGFKLTDYFSTKFATPVADESQDLTLLQASNSNGITAFEYTRPLRTCDTAMDLPFEDHLQWVVYASGASATAFSYHGQETRGTGYVSFLAPPPPSPPSDPVGVQSWFISAPEHELSSEETDYQCFTVDMPTEMRYHVVRWEPVIKSPLVHHIVAFGCADRPQQSRFSCKEVVEGCETVLFAWAPGVTGQTYPSNAGFPIGLGEHGWIVLQLHYNNPGHLLGAKDSSGLRLWYTDELRPLDVGVFWISSNFEDKIQPGEEHYSLATTECASTCMAKFPKEGVTVFNNFLHMHQAGRSISTQQIRDGVELSELGHEEYFDFNFQAGIAAPVGRVILPSDRLRLTCVYNTVGREGTTEAGTGSMDEMCMNFITVIPRPVVTSCFDSVKKNSTVHNTYCIERTDNGGSIVPEHSMKHTPGPYTPYSPPCTAAAAAASTAPSVDLAATPSENSDSILGLPVSAAQVIIVAGSAAFMVMAVSAISYLLARADSASASTAV